MSTLEPEINGQNRRSCCTCTVKLGDWGTRNEVSPTVHSNVCSVSTRARLDASFVHIPHDRHAAGAIPDPTREGLLGSAKLTSALLDVALEGSHTDITLGNELNNPPLCQSCTERVAQALDADIERLLAEAKAYTGTMTTEEDKELGIKKALAINIGIERNTDVSPGQPGSDQLIFDAVTSFQEESQVLKAACIDHDNELKFLNEALASQTHRTFMLEEAEDALCRDMNYLEVAANDFETSCHRHSSKCSEARQEVEKLDSVKLHSALFDVVVHHGGGCKYPIINELRLGFCPKGSLHWNEISAAWAHAAQLIMFVGGAVGFVSNDLRIVPLVGCAKIICVGTCGSRKIVHNLGRDSDRSFNEEDSAPGNESVKMSFALCAFNSLLHQLLSHMHNTVCPSQGVEQPFVMSTHKIGAHDLLKLGEKDNAGWSEAITCIASNLQWLSNSVL